MGASVQTQEKAWQSYEALSRDPRVLFLSESARISSVFKELTQGGFPGHEQWTDAYLAAFAETSEIGMVTFDAGFRHGASLPVQLLT